MAKQYHKNPRQITAKQHEALAIDLAELGDLGGIVHDLNSDEIIGGNQRSRVFDLNACDVMLTEQLAEPDAQGTVARGYVIWKGAKYDYRQVRWTERQAERANIVANKRGGTWDFDILADRFEVDDLLTWGFEPFELGIGEPQEDAAGDGETQTEEQARATLAERFLVPPFSVLDARQGYWQARKSAWIALGIQSELGRGLENVGMAHPETTSTIDFYSRKRALEAELGKELTKDEAAEIMRGGGHLKNARQGNKDRLAARARNDQG